LGDEWPRHAWEKNGQLPGGMAWATGHSVAYFEMIELALWLETLCDREGFAALLRQFRADSAFRRRLAAGQLADQPRQPRHAVRWDVPGQRDSYSVEREAAVGAQTGVSQRPHLLPHGRRAGTLKLLLWGHEAFSQGGP
jgi:hypothetical protein